MMMRNKILSVIIFSAALAATTGARAVEVFPNPVKVTRGQTEVVFDGLASARIKIYTIGGQLVRSASAQSSFRWDLKNDSGRSVASGVYFYVVDDGQGTQTGKVVVIR